MKQGSGVVVKWESTRTKLVLSVAVLLIVGVLSMRAVPHADRAYYVYASWDGLGEYMMVQAMLRSTTRAR